MQFTLALLLLSTFLIFIAGLMIYSIYPYSYQALFYFSLLYFMSLLLTIFLGGKSNESKKK
ncbi:hypothetical protein BFU36_08350 [Sulfolobus sp. A20]|nr:hypothetical protein BFU36_08350 [Sulfolobus sp. A20]TRM77864.1 hypothetical protein DJ532_02955 [Sulfolobus sp. A20-N-F8]